MNNSDFEYREPNRYREVSVRALLVDALRGWRKMLVLGLVLAVLTGCYSVYTGHKQKDAMNAAHEAGEKALQDYNTQAQAIQKNIGQLQTTINNEQQYLDNSVTAQLSPSDTYSLEDTFLVQTPEMVGSASTAGQLAVTKSSNLVVAYAGYTYSGKGIARAAKKLGTTTQCIRECITPEYATSGSSTFKILVRYPDEEGAGVIMDEIEKGVLEQQENLTGIFGTHTIDVVRREGQHVYDTTGATTQQNIQNQIQGLKNAVNAQRTALTSLVQPEVPPAYSKKTLLVSSAKKACVALFAGVLLMYLLLFLQDLVSGRMFSVSEFESRYRLRPLMVFSLKDSPLSRLAGRDTSEDHAAQREKLLLRLENLADAKKVRRILLAGSVSEERVQKLAAQLQELADREGDGLVFTALGSAAEDAAALRQMKRADAFVLVEELCVSRVKQVDQICEMLADTDQPFLGAVLF